MFKSLRWRLQVWHAFVLLIVIASFGGIVHRLHWQTRLQQVDAELDRAAGQVMSQMRRLLPRTNRQSRRQDESKPESEMQPSTDQALVARSGLTETENSLDKPERSPNTQSQGLPTQNPTGQNSATQNAPTPNPQRGQRERNFRDLGPVPAEFEEMFHGEEDSRLYYVIWNEKGEVLQKSDSAPEIKYPNLQIGQNKMPERKARDRVADKVYREMVFPLGYSGRNLLVGRSLEKDFAAYRQSGLFLVITGFVILAAGLIGGGWLTAKAIGSITDMTKAAEGISELHLSERINVKDADTELGQLATVLNRTFDRLQLAFERQSQFTADASHELRTPLSVISAHAELALTRPRTPEEYRIALETCQHAAYRMRTLIDMLLQLARFDSGTSSLKQDDLDLDVLIHDCVDLLQSLADDRKIHVETDTSPCRVKGDESRLSQVVTNLLTNAFRYNVEGGNVRISARVEKKEVVIAVADTGIGIAAKDVPLIFDRFYQVDKVRSRSEGSSGLGLSICKTIVEAHGGTIHVTSELNVGTTVEVRLPLIATSQSASRDSAFSEANLVSAQSGT